MTEQDAIGIIKEIGQLMTKLYHEHVYPAEYHYVHYDNGRRFEMTVKEYRSVEDTQPMRSEI